MTDGRTYYEILGFEEFGEDKYGFKYTKEQIQHRYNQLVSTLPASLMNIINEAYEVLSDNQKRKEYDNFLKSKNKDIYSGVSEPIVVQPTVETPVVEPTVETPAVEPTVETPAVEPTVETPVVEPTVKPAEKQTVGKEEELLQNQSINYSALDEKVRKDMRKAKWIVMGVSVLGISLAVGSLGVGLFLGLPLGTLLGGLAKKKGMKIYRDMKEKSITEVKTPQSKEEREANKKLEKELNQILSQPNNDYKLAITIAKYENRMQLLKKQIDMERKKITKPGQKGLNALNIKALVDEYKSMEEKLEILNRYKEKNDKKYKTGEKESDRKTTNLSELNEKLLKYVEKIRNLESKIEQLKQNNEPIPQTLLDRLDKYTVSYYSILERRDAIKDYFITNQDSIAKRKFFVADMQDRFNSSDPFEDEIDNRRIK